jgi:hypothetical protein
MAVCEEHQQRLIACGSFGTLGIRVFLYQSLLMVMIGDRTRLCRVELSGDAIRSMGGYGG